MNTYQIETTCKGSPNCENLVHADLDCDMDLNADTCDAIDDAVAEGTGQVFLSVDEVRRNPHLFASDEEFEHVIEDEGYTLNVHVPECNECGASG